MVFLHVLSDMSIDHLYDWVVFLHNNSMVEMLWHVMAMDLMSMAMHLMVMQLTSQDLLVVWTEQEVLQLMLRQWLHHVWWHQVRGLTMG